LKVDLKKWVVKR